MGKIIDIRASAFKIELQQLDNKWIIHFFIIHVYLENLSSKNAKNLSTFLKCKNLLPNNQLNTETMDIWTEMLVEQNKAIQHVNYLFIFKCQVNLLGSNVLIHWPFVRQNVFKKYHCNYQQLKVGFECLILPNLILYWP